MHSAQERKRLAAEADTIRRLRIEERHAAQALEGGCRQVVAGLEDALRSEGRWANLRGVVLFVAGAVIGAVTAVASRPATR